ncbi:hypothetical protein EIN_359180 [Entamoeba invadens IP1]|uniref:Uncharacterized protein n=1 Tax=Entamoeba invadens IP1 TaxID=370355 RepID=A0A0A1U7S7_ENTIV|nr:hypothetical protein EIN_359180 [Entamoeba invadens IP1]ELP90835.1 hypothetical protein EIN_359180 [Entamoeba invadens IP1]|eukprot:XP_004257606.1 hypothetical protein EIN_359180 [Entamoeba invadens IP1]
MEVFEDELLQRNKFEDTHIKDDYKTEVSLSPKEILYEEHIECKKEEQHLSSVKRVLPKFNSSKILLETKPRKNTEEKKMGCLMVNNGEPKFRTMPRLIDVNLGIKPDTNFQNNIRKMKNTLDKLSNTFNQTSNVFTLNPTIDQNVDNDQGFNNFENVATFTQSMSPPSDTTSSKCYSAFNVNAK